MSPKVREFFQCCQTANCSAIINLLAWEKLSNAAWTTRLPCLQLEIVKKLATIILVIFSSILWQTISPIFLMTAIMTLLATGCCASSARRVFKDVSKKFFISSGDIPSTFLISSSLKSPFVRSFINNFSCRDVDNFSLTLIQDGGELSRGFISGLVNFTSLASTLKDLSI